MFNIFNRNKKISTPAATNHLLTAYKCKETIGYDGVHAAHTRHIESVGGRPVQRKTIVRYCNNASGTGYTLPKNFVTFIERLSADLKV